MNSLHKHEATQPSARPVILFEIYKDLVVADSRTSIHSPLETPKPKPELPKNRFPGDSSTLAYM
ncbi:hypothetical protein CMPELA_16245 [Cupriavidus necator]|uniref:Uncharacterized protein n=1 Tax=Cupriavidus necator (strain ATCC 17699 / DSM 428 / KCTC 22496 / NCIMB 10442 / H16 / Stanier 337) TaxID=381666 RepID=A0AAE5ZG23_CUPNH|nr:MULTISPECIES: hypothetical protein [Cupriavidus]NSX17024.1 hypothetical protein [Cupriavidus taiwanensis]QCC02054.1 hypothetical protein E6A55_16420 [Cupriavidus necator H16]QQB75112.1 hypothetical protein I6H87_09730 [Cupriavidus necator]WKA40460.1 hypothetical protein QWP09_16450 [Cupriavidus necator]